MIRLEIQTPEEMAELGRRIARQLQAGDILALNGELGAGKTTLARGLGEELGVRGAVTSPTFVLARTHPRTDGGAPLVHVDAYRLGSAAELDDLDIDFDGSIVVVEWAARMLDGISDSLLEVSIARPTGTGGATPGSLSSGSAASADADGAPVDTEELGGPEPRQVTIRPLGPRWERHPFT